MEQEEEFEKWFGKAEDLEMQLTRCGRDGQVPTQFHPAALETVNVHV